MANRIADAIARKEKEIPERIAQGLTTAEKVETLRNALDMELFEYAKFQELKTLAVSANLISLDEGNTIYAYLGNTPSVFNGQSVAVKSVLTSFYSELLKLRLRGKL